MQQVVTHRDHLGPKYKGISIHAPAGLHELVYGFAHALFNRSESVLELGAGSGALSLRLQDGGFMVKSVDLDGGDWTLDIPLTTADMNLPLWYEQAFVDKRPQRFRWAVVNELRSESWRPPGRAGAVARASSAPPPPGHR